MDKKNIKLAKKLLLMAKTLMANGEAGKCELWTTNAGLDVGKCCCSMYFNGNEHDELNKLDQLSRKIKKVETVNEVDYELKSKRKKKVKKDDVLNETDYNVDSEVSYILTFQYDANRPEVIDEVVDILTAENWDVEKL